MPFYLDAETDARLRRERSTRQYQFQQLQAQVSQGLADRVLSLSQAYPAASNGVITGTALAGMSPEEARQVMEQDTLATDSPSFGDYARGFFGTIIGGAADIATDVADAAYQQVIKPTVRTAFTIADTAAQELVQRPLTAALVTASGQTDFASAYRDYGNSAGVEALQGLVEGEPLEGLLGAGIFAGGRAQAESERQRTLMIEGERATFGRAFTNNTVGHFADPGSTAWNTTQFLSQLSIDVFGDPTVLLTGGSPTAARLAARTGLVTEGGRAATLLGEGVQGLRRARTAISLQDQRSFRRVFEAAEDAGQDFRSTFRLEDEAAVQRFWEEQTGILEGNPIRRGDPNTVKVTRDEGFTEFDLPVGYDFVTSYDDAGELNGIAILSHLRGEPSDLSVVVRPDSQRRGIATRMLQAGEEAGLASSVNIEAQDLSQYGAALASSFLSPPTPSVPQRMADAAGAISNPWRRTLLTEKVNLLTENTDLLQRVAEMDAADVLRVVSRDQRISLTGSQIQRMAEATTPDEALALLGELVGTGSIRDTRSLRGLGEFQRDRNTISHLLLDNPIGRRISRFAGLSPVGRMSIDDLPGTALRLDGLMRQVNIGDDLRRSTINQLFSVASESTGTTQAAFTRFRTVLTDAYSRIAAAVPGGEVDEVVEGLEESARSLLRIRDEGMENVARTYLRDVEGGEITTAINRAYDADGNIIQGGAYARPQIVQQLAEMSHYMDGDTVRGLRRAAERNRWLRRAYTSRTWDRIEGATRILTLNTFKPLVLLRPAYAAREFLDGQIRLAGANSDYDTLFSSPLRYISSLIASKADAATFMGDDIQRQAERFNILSQDIYNVMRPSQGERARDMLRIRRAPVGDTGRNASLSGWRWNMQHYAADEGVRALANADWDVQRWVDEWVLSEKGETYFSTLSQAGEDYVVYRNLRSLEAQEALEELGNGLRQMLVGDDGLGGVLGGVNSPVMELFRNGTIAHGDRTLSLFRRSDTGRINRWLDQHADDFMPDEVWAPRTERPRFGRSHERTVMQTLASGLMSKPANYFTRYPALRQRLIKNSIDLLADVESPGVRQEIAERLGRDFNLTRFEQADLRRALDSADTSGGGARLFSGYEDAARGAEDFGEVVKARSFDEAIEDLFDIGDRSGVQDAFAQIAPFYDAYNEALTTYFRLFRENPSFFLKGAQGFQSMREQGFFSVNDFGEEVFTMPGGGGLTAFVNRMAEGGGGITSIPGAAVRAAGDVVTGNVPEDPVTLEGRVQGLNIVLNGVGPGFGPVVQWAAGAFLPDDPTFSEIREFVNPFGSEFTNARSILDPKLYVESLMPAWASKFTNAVTEGQIDPVQFNSMVGDALRVFAESGRYDPANPDDQRRLVEDAGRAGRFMLLVRGLAQGVAPTGPSATWRLRTEQLAEAPDGWEPEADPDGTMHTLLALGNEYRRMQDTYGDDAARIFFEMYGHEPWYIAQGKTRSVGVLPVTAEGQRWVNRHNRAADLYPSVIGFFAPESSVDEFDYSVYRQQIESGQRQMLTPTQQIQLANQTRARQMYYNIRGQLDQAGVSGRQRQTALNSVKQYLETEFPGWQLGVIGVQEAADYPDRLRMFEQAAFDDDLADSPIAPSARRYLTFRRQLLDFAIQRSGGTATQFGSSRDRDLLDGLNQYGTMLATEDPNFRGIWQSFLNREVT